MGNICSVCRTKCQHVLEHMCLEMWLFVCFKHNGAPPNFSLTLKIYLGYRHLGRWMVVVVPNSGHRDLQTSELGPPPPNFYRRGAHASSGDPTKIGNTRYILEVCHPRCVCENWKGYVVKQHCQLRRLMTILDNHMFRPLLAIFRLSSRELKVLLYIYIYVYIYTVIPRLTSDPANEFFG